MKSILKLLLADIRHKKSNFGSIAALMMIITVSFSGTVSNNDNLGRALESSFENTGVGNLLVTVTDENYTVELEDSLLNDEYVTSLRADELIAVNGKTEIEGKKLKKSIYLEKFTDKVRVMNDNTDGFINGAAPKAGEAFIGYSLAVSGSFEKGDRITVETRNGTEEFTVAGFVEDPVYGALMINSEKFFICAEDYDRILSERLDAADAPYKYLQKVYMLHIFSDGRISDKDLSGRLNSECGVIDKSLVCITRNELSGTIKINADIGTKMLAVFVVLLSAAVVIIIHNSISTSAEMDYVDLGILKSQGFTSLRIRVIYILQYIIALFAGTVVGIVLSVPLTRFLGKKFIILTCILTTGEVSVLKCFAVALAIAVMCAFSAVISTSRIKRISPVQAIRGGSADVYFDSRMNIPVRKSPLALFIALRQITSKAGTYAGTCVITALLVFFMISIGAMVGDLDVKTLMGDNSSMRVGAIAFDNFEYSDMERVREAVKKEFPDADIFWNTVCKNGTVDGVVYEFTVTDDVERQAKVYDGRTPMYENEIAITGIVEEETGRHIGDTFTINTSSGTYDFIVTGLYQTTSNFGSTFIMNYEAGKRLGIGVQSGAVCMETCSDEDISRIVSIMNDNFGDILRAEKYEPSSLAEGEADLMDGILDVVVIVVYSMSCVFGLLVVVMLSRKALLREQKDIGIYKAQGFSVSSLRLQFSVRFTVVAVIGSVIGAILSSVFTKPMFSAIFSKIGIIDFISSFDFLSAVLPAAVISLSFFLSAYVSSGRIKKVNVRELITE